MLTYSDGLWVKKVADPLPQKTIVFPYNTITNGTFCLNIDAQTGDPFVLAYDLETNTWVTLKTK